MAEAFTRRGDRFVGVLEPVELEVVLGLLRQTREVVAPPALPPSRDPFEELLRQCGLADHAGTEPADVGELVDRDPALDRLVPPAHREDEALAAEYRRFTERSVRERKTAQLDRAIEVMEGLEPGRCSLTDVEVVALVVALTDVRLLLGERLGLREDADAERLEEEAAGLDTQHPLVALLSYYDFLTWLQDVLVGALTG